jgi:uroporphyrinogen decarboxylase
MARVQVAAWESIGQDVIFPDADNFYIAEAFGCRSHLEKDNYPSLASPAFEDPQRVFHLEVPDPERDGRMPVYLAATRLIADAVGDQAAIRVPGTGPFALAAYMIGIEAFLYEIGMIMRGLDLNNLSAMERMLEIATETVTRFGLAQIRAGANILQCGDSLASGSMIRPQAFQRFVLPYHQQIFSTWKQAGAVTVLHICGANEHMLELFADTGADIVAIDSLVDLHRAKEKIGSRVALIGNIDPVGVMLNGTSDQVEKTARQCIDAAGAGGGYILGTGCEVPLDSPVENLIALVRVAHEYPIPQ